MYAHMSSWQVEEQPHLYLWHSKGRFLHCQGIFHSHG